jgi:UDP-N-acetylmuramyl tripeptide synthase
VLVLNADDDGLVAHAKALAGEIAEQQKTIVWFSLSSGSACIEYALSQREPCGWLRQDSLWYFDGNDVHEVMPLADIPITMNGAARYNVQNALGVMCLCIAFNLSLDAVRAGFSRFHNSPADNPGRCNEFEIGGARVFVDFAHNPHSISAVASTMANIAARRRFLMLGHAGDRSDDEICGLTAGAFELRPDHIVITELPDYLRGRESGEVSSVIRDECLRRGLEKQQMSFSDDPLSGTQRVLSLLQEGDLALLLVHSQRDEIIQLLSANAA